MSNDEEIQFEYDDDFIDIDKKRHFLEMLDAIKIRCKEAKIAFDELEAESGEKYLRVQLPSGRDTQPVVIGSMQKAERFLSVDFEKYVILKGYDAVCSYTEGTVEALIKQHSPFPSPSLLYKVLFGVDVREARNSQPQIVLRPIDEENGTQITLGFASPQCAIITDNHRYSSNFRYLSVRITGLKVTQHDKALEYLERIADSLFFEIDLLTGISLSLGRTRRTPERRLLNKSQSRVELSFPKFEYNHEAMSLYWYASGARGMPLLQYLAFYQVVEVYFPIYSRLEAQKRVRNILKVPSFNPMNDLDIGKILTAIRANKNKGFGDERSQLKAAIQECITPDGLRNFLTGDEKRAEFFGSKQKTISDCRIPLSNPDADLRNEIAERIYDIRCKIVHTKDVGDNEEETVGLLLPFSKEAELLTYDIELIQYIAQQILITSSTILK